MRMNCRGGRGGNETAKVRRVGEVGILATQCTDTAGANLYSVYYKICKCTQRSGFSLHSGV